MEIFIKQYSKIMDFLVKLIEIILAIALAIMTLVTFVEVIRRYVLGQSFVWAEELTRFLLVGMTFIGGAAAYKIGGMASFDLLISHVAKGRPMIGKAIKIVDNAIIGAVSAYLAVKGFGYTFSPMVAKMQSLGLKMNMSIVYISIPIGFLLIVLFAIEQVLQAAAEKGEGEDK